LRKAVARRGASGRASCSTLRLAFHGVCEASYSTLWLCQNDGYRAAAIHGDLSAPFVEQWRNGSIYRPAADVTLAQAMLARKPVQEADLRNSPQYRSGQPLPVSAVEIAGIRSLVVVPMLNDNEPVGAIAIYRKDVGPFGEKQIELVQNFATQAVIAIENTRLLNELRESLQQQTATADVLKVISSSPGELEPVFRAMLENATRICGAQFGNLLLYDGEAFRFAVVHGAPRAWEDLAQREPVFRVRPNSPLGRLAATHELQHTSDVRRHEAYVERQPATVALVELAGARALLVVPMLKEDQLVGAFGIYRQEERPFTDKQVELVTNFAAQAVIAIENTRLLNELRESLQQQTATADVLKVSRIGVKLLADSEIAAVRGPAMQNSRYCPRACWRASAKPSVISDCVIQHGCQCGVEPYLSRQFCDRGIRGRFELVVANYARRGVEPT
jgi:GAF domain-containing protein